VKRTLLRLIVAAVLIIAFLLYRSRSRSNLNVEPHAREVIEKAKRR
jgi:Flp pilus assembly protein protease CpaA